MRTRYPYRVRDVEALRERMKSSTRVVPHSVRSLAALVGSNRTTVGDLLTGDQERLSEGLAHSLATALGAAFDDLFVLDASGSGDTDDLECAS